MLIQFGEIPDAFCLADSVEYKFNVPKNLTLLQYFAGKLGTIDYYCYVPLTAGRDYQDQQTGVLVPNLLSLP